MTKPSFFVRGQITVFVLLLGLLGLTIGMSAASRSLSDLKQATYTETGTKALAGAEAGMELALANLNNGSLVPNKTGCTSLVDAAIGLTGFSSVKYQACTDVTDYFSKIGLPVEDVFDLDISGLDYLNPTTPVNGLRIHWNNTSGAVEVAYLDTINTVKRYAVNGTAVPVGQGNFSTGVSGNGGCGPTGGSYFDISPINTGTLLRVKALLTTLDISVCPLNGVTILAQKVPSYRVVAIATTAGGTVKKLTSLKSSTGLPSVFDNAFFSAGNIVQN